ncbi:MAG TPA: AAA family ATPase [Mobilitalea sp.]|nr:AAA family ATPase [Mobilitalea sp.]
MNKGIIIWLNGVSSSGKTTLTRVLQKKLEEPYYWLANDTFCDMSPEKLWDIDASEAEYQALSMLNHTIKLFSDMGKNIIVDHVLISTQKGDLLKKSVDLLHEYPVLFVHVVCPIDELRRREIERGDRNIGQAESQLTILNPQETYDITVDTYENTVEECADEIIKMLGMADCYSAFKILKNQL